MDEEVLALWESTNDSPTKQATNHDAMGRSQTLRSADTPSQPMVGVTRPSPMTYSTRDRMSFHNHLLSEQMQAMRHLMAVSYESLVMQQMMIMELVEATSHMRAALPDNALQHVPSPHHGERVTCAQAQCA